MADTKRPKRIYAFGTFTNENKGDAALLESFRALLLRSVGPFELRLPSTRPDLDRPYYGSEVMEMPIDPHGLIARLIHRIGRILDPAIPGYLAACQLLAFEAMLGLLGTSGTPRFGRLVPQNLRAAWVAIAEADLVAALPGGYMVAPEPSSDIWMYHAASVLLAHHLGRRIVLFPGSYGPFVGVHRPLARRVLARCDWIMAREAVSLSILQDLRLSGPVLRLVPDAGFAFRDDGRGEAEIAKLAGTLPSGEPLLVGISVMPHRFPGDPNPPAQLERYLDSVAAAADRLIELGAHVVFVPQSVGSTGDDARTARHVKARMRVPSAASVLDRELSPFALSALYARLQLMVGTRMHANILSIAQGVPVVAIAYQHKTPGIMAMAGLADWVVNIESISPAELITRVEEAWTRRLETRTRLAGTTVPYLVGRIEEGVVDALAPDTRGKPP